jgi:hypothetical protein
MISLSKLDRPARHRGAAFLFRGIAIALLWQAVEQFSPVPPGSPEFIRTALAYLACLILAMILCLVAVLHDLVAATLRPKIAWRTLSIADRVISEGIIQ